jgi:hypothetical protein
LAGNSGSLADVKDDTSRCEEDKLFALKWDKTERPVGLEFAAVLTNVGL